MINIAEWDDYMRSASRVRCIEHNVSSGKAPRLLVFGVRSVLSQNGFVPEVRDYALELIGEKTPNSSSN